MMALHCSLCWMRVVTTLARIDTIGYAATRVTRYSMSKACRRPRFGGSLQEVERLLIQRASSTRLQGWGARLSAPESLPEVIFDSDSSDDCRLSIKSGTRPRSGE